MLTRGSWEGLYNGRRGSWEGLVVDKGIMGKLIQWTKGVTGWPTC